MALTRRGFLATTLAATTVRVAPMAASMIPKQRVILRLVYDKSAGMMRAVEKLVPF